MSEQMDFDDGKYTVVSDNGRLKALRYGQPWRDLTGDHLVYAMLVKAIQLKEERDALAAKLKDQDARINDLLATCHRLALELECLLLDTKDAAPVSRWWDSAMAALDGWHKAKDAASARPVLTYPVNARLVAAAKAALDALTCSGEADDPGHRCGHCDDYVDRNGVVRAALRDALASAEAQQAEPVRLTRESVARAIWSVRREHEDRCDLELEDLELEDMQDIHPVWREADAVLAVTELAQSKPALMTIEQARDSERYAYLRSQHEGSVAASFAVFAPEQPIGEFGPVGSMPGELDAAIDAAIRANGYKVEG